MKISIGNASAGFMNWLGIGTGGTTTCGCQGTVLTAPIAFQTAATHRTMSYIGHFVGDGTNFKVQWAQNSSQANQLTVFAGSILRYKQLD
jgi:hypothetical protein